MAKAKAKRPTKPALPEVIVARDARLMLEVAVHSNDRGTKELRAKHETALEETMQAGVKRRRVVHECRLDWYWDKCMIIDRQHEAGMKFRRDWLISAATANITASYGRRVSGSQEFTTIQIAARMRSAKALGVLTPDESAKAISVCGLDEWAGGLSTLRDALTKLADHYGLERAQ